MKIKSVVSILLLFILCFLMFSCKIFGGKGSHDGSKKDNNGSDNAGENRNVIWSDSIVPVIVKSHLDTDSDRIALYDELRVSLYNFLDRHSSVVSDDVIPEGSEIVLGQTDRKISSEAKKVLDDKLAAALKEYDEDGSFDDELVGFTVYSSEGSVAIVWSFETLCSEAIDYFVDNYFIGPTLVLEEGYSKTVVYKRSEYFASLEEQIYDETWLKLGAAIDEEYSESIVSAMQTLYTIYTDDMYIWLANLYDPEVGGFYHSDSARDTIGFLPDIESTSTALSFITSTRMKTGYFGDYIPDWLKEQVASFVSSLQAPDGYFYHPQWGENVTTSRLGRDLSSAKALLNACGIRPKYSYPGTASSSSLSTPLKQSSTAVSVSYVIGATDSAVPERFRSAANWQNYLDSNAALIAEGKQDFYVFGNTLQSQLSQMADFGKKYGVNFKKLTTDFLTKHQNTETGFWSSSLDYNATNGFHKISDVYNSAGVEIPNADKAIESTVAVMKSDLQIIAGVEVYNSWSCFAYIIKNIRNYASGTSTEREEKISAIKDKVYEIAPEAILASYKKIAPLRKPDGSFSYGLLYSADSVQDAPAAVPNTFEGDINGNALACTSLVTHIYSALDLSSYMVPIFTEVDYILYMEELSRKSGVIKDELNTEKIVYDFEECKDGDSVPADFASNRNGGDLVIKSLGEEKNKVLAYTCPGGSNPTLDFPINKLNASPNHAVFEFDVCYEDATGHEFLLIGSAGNILQVYTSVSGGNVTLKNKGDTSNILASFKVGTFNTLRLEYYWNEGYLAVYLNDSEYPTGITEAVLSNGKHQPLTSIHVGAAKAMVGTAYFDNISLEVNLKSAEESKMPSLKPLESVTYDFEEFEVGATDIYPLGNDTTRPGLISVMQDGNNRLLNYACSESTETSNPCLLIPANPVSRTPNMAVFEMKALFGDCSLSTLYIHTSTQICYFEFKISGNRVLMTNGADPSFVLLNVSKDKFFELRLEYYWTEGYFAIYENDSETPICTNVIMEGKAHGALQKIEFIANRSSVGGVKFDNIKFDLMYVENPPKYTAPPAPGSEVYEFEDADVGSTDVYPLKPSVDRGGEYYIAEDSSGNKYLKYICSDSTSSTNPLFKLEPNSISENPNLAVIEMDLSFETGKQIVLNIYNTKGGLTHYNIKSNGTEIYVEDGANGNFKLTKTPYQATVKLKVVYYWTEGYFAITLGNEKTVYTTAIREGKSHLALRDIDIYSDKAYTGIIGLDNIVFDMDYIETPPEMPKPESVVHDFDGGSFDNAFFSVNDESGTRGGTVSVKSDSDGNGYLEYACSESTSTSNPELIIYPNQMSNEPNAVHIEMDIYFEEFSNLYLTFYTSSGSINYYEFKLSGDEILIRDSSNSNITLVSSNKSEVLKLKIWYYPEEGFFAVSLGDGDPVYASSIKSGKSHGMLTRIGMYSDKGYTGVIRFDNVVFDVLYTDVIPEI